MYKICLSPFRAIPPCTHKCTGTGICQKYYIMSRPTSASQTVRSLCQRILIESLTKDNLNTKLRTHQKDLVSLRFYIESQLKNPSTPLAQLESLTTVWIHLTCCIGDDPTCTFLRVPPTSIRFHIASALINEWETEVVARTNLFALAQVHCSLLLPSLNSPVFFVCLTYFLQQLGWTPTTSAVLGTHEKLQKCLELASCFASAFMGVKVSPQTFKFAGTYSPTSKPSSSWFADGRFSTQELPHSD